ncbi:hypothetical protein [Egbenema bharatensis]|uniref:hypothetical protein n=1 Tax=Egbenema bharatensis TaxID=3463334 RepID=UPI003A855874
MQAQNVVGQPGTALFTNDSKALLQARKRLNQIHAPQTDRFLVVDVDTETDMTELVEKQNGPLSLQSPFALGQRLGFNCYYDVYNPMHEAGSASSNENLVVGSAQVETVIVSTQYLGINLKGDVKQYYLNIDEATSGETIHKGDILQIAGVPGYVNALEDAEAEAGVIRVLIDRYVDAQEAAAVTVYPDHVISLAGHRSAIGMAVRNLGNSIPDKGISTSMTDESGLTLTLDYYPGFKMGTWVLSCLFGTSVIRPEALVKLIS